MRGWVGTSLLFFIAGTASTAPAAAAAYRPLEIRVLRAAAPKALADSIPTPALESQFEAIVGNTLAAGRGTYWLEIRAMSSIDAGAAAARGVPVLIVQAARETGVDVYATGVALPMAATLAAYRGIQDRVYAVPHGFEAGPLYVRIDTSGIESRGVSFFDSTLAETLDRGAEHARMITLAVGAMMSMALSALLIWFILADKLFMLYATLFFLQALYIVFLSGQGFDWPILAYARPLSSFAWNVPAGLSGAVFCLFSREIADLKNFSPRIYDVFGWFALAFVAITIANVAKLFGFGTLVNAVGNLFFLLVAVFTLVVAFLSWRRGNRAAGWFLIAWGLLQGFIIAATLRFLGWSSDENESLLYYGLPLSMVAAAVLIALGIADRLRQQQVALTDAELRAGTDPLTGVLNRRSLIERLDAACMRARARGLPIALLFIDLDHFKQINDSYGHQAGDACLRGIIGPMQAELRQSDVVGRYGGEEFVVILSGADAAAAQPIAQRIRERIANVRIDGFGPPISFTCSIGVATSDRFGLRGEHLIAHADAAVYAAKRSGRNQVQMAAPAG